MRRNAGLWVGSVGLLIGAIGAAHAQGTVYRLGAGSGAGFGGAAALAGVGGEIEFSGSTFIPRSAIKLGIAYREFVLPDSGAYRAGVVGGSALAGAAYDLGKPGGFTLEGGLGVANPHQPYEPDRKRLERDGRALSFGLRAAYSAGLAYRF